MNIEADVIYRILCAIQKARLLDCERGAEDRLIIGVNLLAVDYVRALEWSAVRETLDILRERLGPQPPPPRHQPQPQPRSAGLLFVCRCTNNRRVMSYQDNQGAAGAAASSSPSL